MSYVCKLENVTADVTGKKLLYAILDTGKVVVTDYLTGVSKVLGNTIFEYGDRFAVNKQLQYVCGSYSNNIVEHYDSQGSLLYSYKIKKPQSIATWGYSFLVVNENRDVYLLNQGKIESIPKEACISVKKVAENIVLFEQEDGLELMNPQRTIKLEGLRAPVVTASLQKDLLAVAFLKGKIGVYDLNKSSLIESFSFAMDGQCQAALLVSRNELLFLGQTFQPFNERWLATMNLISGNIDRICDLSFDGGLGIFIDDFNLCRNGGDLISSSGKVVKRFSFLPENGI